MGDKQGFVGACILWKDQIVFVKLRVLKQLVDFLSVLRIENVKKGGIDPKKKYISFLNNQTSIN